MTWIEFCSCSEGRRSFQLSYGRLIDSKRFRVVATIHLLPFVSHGVNPYFETVFAAALPSSQLSASLRWLWTLAHLSGPWTRIFVIGTLTQAGTAARWERHGIGAQELTMHLLDTSASVKSVNGNLCDYKRRMALAIRIFVMGANEVEI